MNNFRFYFAIVASAILFSCTSKIENLPDHAVRFINIKSGVKLEVLDWGGKGSPVLFLTGLGNSAHVYDDFAPKFTDKFHVYALTRRGFGASSQPSDGYDIKTLAHDILLIIDSLHIKKVILIGHSIAGEEITRFAGSYPDRVDKIIYLDAAYDNTSMEQLSAVSPEFPLATAKDSASLYNVKQFMHRLTGVDFPDEEIKQTSVFSKEGKYLKDVTSGSILGAFYNASEKPSYKDIRCRSLAIYATPESVNGMIPFYPGLDSLNKKKADQLFLLWPKIESENQNHYKKETPDGVVKTIKGTHYIFLSNPDATEKSIREFIE